MNQVLEEVFLHDDVRGGKAVGFITWGQGAVAQSIGYIVKHEELGAVYVAYACHPSPFLTPSHLQTIANRLKHLNARQESTQEKAQAPPRH